MTIVFSSCEKKDSVVYSVGKTPIVQVESNVLYKEDLQKVMPLDCSEEDSIAFVDRYIKNWISDLMFYKNAVKNIPDTKSIDQLVENYRHSLILHEYQQRLIEQKINNEISDAEIEKFYNENMRLFILEEPVIKGLFLKIPLTAPNLSKVRNWYKQNDDNTFEEIEKYSIKYAIRYDFFYDHWVKISDIEMLLPSDENTLESKIINNKSFEFKDDECIYLLNVSEYVPKGRYEPLDLAHNQIANLLINNKEVSYMKRIKDELYQSAVDNNKIKYFEDIK